MERSRGNNSEHDIIVVGASAGGVEALSALVRGLPADLPAAVFVVLHIPPYHQSHLPAILSHHGPPVRQIPALVGRLAREPAAYREASGVPTMSDIDTMIPQLMRRDIAGQERNERSGQTSVYTCPECGGTLWQVDHDDLMQFNCHVGHAYAAEALLGQMSEDLEAALWRCVRLLTEKATLTRQLAGRLRAAGQQDQAARVEEQAHLDDRHGELIRSVLRELTPNPVTQ